MERNKFLEMGGLAHKTDTHEWYNDTIGTIQAQREDRNFVRLLHITCYVVRNIKTGEYDRVVMDTKKTKITFQFLTYDQRKAKIIANFNSIKVDPIKSQVTTTGVWTPKTN